MRKSKITCVFDFFLYLLIIGSTIVISYLLWTRVHWLLAIILSFPICRVIFYSFAFLTAPLYNWLTPENKAWSIGCKAMFECDDDTASRAFEAIERWDDGGDCAELQECCKRIREVNNDELELTCPQCGHYAAARAKIGDRAICPKCKAKFTIPETKTNLSGSLSAER